MKSQKSAVVEPQASPATASTTPIWDRLKETYARIEPVVKVVTGITTVLVPFYLWFDNHYAKTSDLREVATQLFSDVIRQHKLQIKTLVDESAPWIRGGKQCSDQTVKVEYEIQITNTWIDRHNKFADESNREKRMSIDAVNMCLGKPD